MERLTFDDLNKVCYDPWELCGMDSYCKKGCHEEGGCAKGCHILKMYRKLAEYEDMEEQGLFEKLIPKKPKVDRYYYSCPTCGEYRSIKQKHNYCHDCGQAFDWRK